MSNPLKRIISGVILAPLVVYILLNGGISFFVMIMLLFLLMFYEWVILTAKFKQPLLWWIFGFFYLGFSCFVMLFLERFRYNFLGFDNIPVHLFIIVFLVWINDIFSYIFGKAIGGPKLVPKISPGKTWAGTIGGISACVFVFFVMYYLTSSASEQIPSDIYSIALSLHILIPIIALCGDLFESWIKRKAGVKDSGNLIPGHGGVLDRMDGLVMVMNIAGISFLAILFFR